MATDQQATKKFEVFTAPDIQSMGEGSTDVDYSQGFDITGLLENHDEDEARDAVNEMWRALSPGMSATLLYGQPFGTGMLLGHAWFGPNLQLFSHSHPSLGDCLYYVLAGEAIMGKRSLKAGDGFFIPNGTQYKFRAGPAGLEILEFRAGGGIEGAPNLKIGETSLKSVRRITEVAKEHRDSWSAPAGLTDHSLSGQVSSQ